MLSAGAVWSDVRDADPEPVPAAAETIWKTTRAFMRLWTTDEVGGKENIDIARNW